MNSNIEEKRIAFLEEKTKLLTKIISLQEEVDRLNKLVNELTEQLVAERELSRRLGDNETNSSIFPKTGKKKDTTRYEFDGITYKKNRLVLAVVQKYASQKKDISAEELMKTFSKDLQGSLGVVRLVDDVTKTYSECEKRFFMGENEIISTSSGLVTVCSQWHAKNIDSFIARAQSLGMRIELCEF